MEAAKLIIEVMAGLIPGRPESEFTKRWAVTSKEWHDAKDDHTRAVLMVGRGAEADEYARTLRDPSAMNWVRTDWVWI